MTREPKVGSGQLTLALAQRREDTIKHTQE